MLSKVFIGIIKFYQLVISPYLPGRCRFYPTCSNFAVEAFSRYGFFVGSYFTLRRVIKCHPFHPGGVDFLENYKVNNVLYFFDSFFKKKPEEKRGL